MLSYRFGRKSQSSMFILLSVVAIIVSLWIFSLFSSTTFYERESQRILLTKLTEYLNYVKGFSRQSLLLSTHAATKQVAAQGGEVSSTGLPRSWICNSDISPKVDEVRFFLSEETRKYLNQYISNLKIEDLPTINVTNFTCVDYAVSAPSVLSGEHDEEFDVGGYGSMIQVNLSSNVVSSKNDVFERISQNRFWYFYRIFKEWSPLGAQMLVTGMCNCLKYICNCPQSPSYPGNCEGCGATCPAFQKCLERVLKKAKDVLQSKFDDYVDCEVTLLGCYHELIPCKGREICEAWNAPKCNSCNIQEAGELCSKHLWSEEGFLNYQGAECGECEYWAETRGSMEAVFSCSDRKYYLSTEGDRTLTFSIHAQVSMKKKNCEKTFECEKCLEKEETNCRVEKMSWKEFVCDGGYRIVERKIPIYDNEGNIIGYKVVKVKECINGHWVTKTKEETVCDVVCKRSECYEPPQCCTPCR